MWLVNSEDFKNYTAACQSIITIVVLLGGGLWAYFRFREGKPKIDLTLDVVFIRRQGTQWIITVEAFIQNKGRVRHKFKDFTLEIRYKLLSDELKNEKTEDKRTRKGLATSLHQTNILLNKAYHWLPRKAAQIEKKKETSLSVKFPHLAAKGSWLADVEDPDDRDDYGALEPGETDRWTFIACVPLNVTMVQAQSELYDKQSKESWEAIKVVAAPRIARK
jgi:hypothetical protein